MSAHAEFAERLQAFFTTELRRQGVTDEEGWAEKLNTYCSYVPATSADDRSSGAGDRQRASPSTVLVIDMTNLEVGDKPVVALCESLLKMAGLSWRGRYADVSEWQVLWRRCGLTDRVVRHLELLLLGCQRLTLLDVSANALSTEGQASLLHAAAEVPCDVVIAEDARATHSGSRTRETSVPSSSLCTPFPREFAERQCHSQASRHRRRSGGDGNAAEGSTRIASHGAIEQQRSSGARRQSTSPPGQAATPRLLRQLSPPFSGASASASPSLRSYASGSAEALQKRREELFGRSNTAAPATAAVPPTAATASARDVPTPRRSVDVRKGVSTGSTTTSDSVVEFEAVLSTATDSPAAAERPHPQRRPAEEGTRTGGSHSPFAAAAARRGQPSAHRTGGAHTASTSVKADAASREPFVDRNDQIDLTANLSPVLDSVLDLSALMTRDGALREARMFGGALTVWDVLEAYESAAEQQLHGSVSHGGETSVDAATSAKLPSALLGGATYNAITVLNLSRNHLTALCALPGTLLRLDVSENNLTELSGLQGCKMLTVLNARRNRLRAISGLEKNLSVAHLFLGHNGITAVEGVAHLVLLETLDLTYNELRTWASLRMLSLCSALRHLLLRGNPIMESGKPGFMAVLRNLCPTLLVVDEHRMANSCLADRALAQRNWGRQPNMINNTQPYARTETLRGGSGAGASSSLLSHAAKAGSSASVDGSAMSSVAFTSSRRRGGSQPAPFAAGDEDVADERSMNLLHMLTRGVTAPTGYGDSVRSQQAAQQLAQTQREKEAQAQAARKRRVTANGRLLRGAVVKQLAEESRKYLEDTIVRRMATAQQQHLQGSHSALPDAGGGSSDAAGVAASNLMTRHGSVERNAYGGMAHPERMENPMADVMGYTAASPEKRQRASTECGVQDKTDAELLRRYKPRAARLRRDPSAKPSQSLTAEASAGPPSQQQQQQQQALQRRTASAGRAPSPAASEGGVLYGPAVVTRGQSARRTHRDGDDAALAALYAGDARGRPSGEAARGASGSYAALHVADQRQPRAPEDAEIECSPISKDPQARVVASLNTTASILQDNAQPYRMNDPPHSAHLRTPPTSIRGHPSPTAQARRHPTPQGYREPAEVDVTAIYPRSRSQRSPSPGVGGDTQKEQRQRYQRLPSRRNASASKPSSRSRSTSAAAVASSATRGSSVGGRGAESGAAAPSVASSAGARSPSLRPVHIDDAQRARVRGWVQQLHDDTDALHDALQTLVDLLEAQRQKRMPVPESSRELPPTYLQERRRCVQIIEGSGMLQDTYVPMDVVVYYGFSRAELEGQTDRSMQVVARRGGGTEADERAWAHEVAERSDVLRQVHLMGDAKTCLRYVVLLVGDGREKLLQQYVDQLKESLRSV
ncbi:conserved hypothetical protein [Leishmania major strain Friedlin]|uniref:Leucine-rich repeat protein n=1 Tax=Leishmania major TaxID=5664 RepID=E9ACN2_LEIMA|nr:conserved hypothetical protein [Leishmania major strain Friedlin]CAG9567313.1 hypothetical_protein_-_conserved [Leishmania major strain Friedlin]CBZ12049.1 conserved hypothetical protein [Leishmania major strain Friedlin]|eukprot:XP_003721763.1 conserved hypothetical protein [Leishmania major strain Friedlin]